MTNVSVQLCLDSQRIVGSETMNLMICWAANIPPGGSFKGADELGLCCVAVTIGMKANTHLHTHTFDLHAKFSLLGQKLRHQRVGSFFGPTDRVAGGS